MVFSAAETALFRTLVKDWLHSEATSMLLLADTPSYGACYFDHQRAPVHDDAVLWDGFCETLGGVLMRTPFRWAETSVLDGSVLGLSGVCFSVAPHVFDRNRWNFCFTLGSHHERLMLQSALNA